MKKISKGLCISAVALLALSTSFVSADYEKSGCSGSDKMETKTIVNEYKGSKKDKVLKRGDVMKKIKTMLEDVSVEKLEMINEKVASYEKKISKDNPKYAMIGELMSYIDVLIARKTASGDIVDVAVSSGDFPTLVAAVQAAGLVDTLKSDGPFTVFAPTEEAFANLLAALDVTAEELLADKELLTSVLTYHVLSGVYQASDVVGLAAATDIATVNGATVSVNPNGGAPKINEANIVATDVFGTNGIIHVIDTVLVPAS